jgi:S-adenosylmethionine hydrolase
MTTPPLSSVFFLSDYGTEDEFVGVVHAVLATSAPGLRVIDLTHQCPAFDVRAGAHTLMRAVPHLGSGVVLAVVDPGVGSARHGLCLPVDGPEGTPSYFIGPDNGILIGAAELVTEAPIAAAYALHRSGPVAERGATFDGRDLFAPAVAALCNGAAPDEIGGPIDPASLVRLPGGVVEHGRDGDGRSCLRAEITWVDHFGNAQLAATVADARRAGWKFDGTMHVTVATDNGLRMELRCVAAFGELSPAELGLLLDANGQVAMVAGEASAAHWLGVGAGELVVLEW